MMLIVKYYKKSNQFKSHMIK